MWDSTETAQVAPREREPPKRAGCAAPGLPGAAKEWIE